MFEDEFPCMGLSPRSWSETSDTTIAVTNYKKQLLEKPSMIPFAKFTRSNGATIYVNANNIAYLVSVGETQVRLVFVGGPEPANDTVIVQGSISQVADSLRSIGEKHV